MKELCEKQQLDNVKKSGDGSADFERAIFLTGYGRYHVMLTLVCGLAGIASGFQNGLSAYILPAAQCDLRLSTSEMGLLNASFLIGGTTSAMLWGILADVIGRRPIIVWCLFTDGVLTLLSCLSQNFPIFFIFRFVSGFMIGGPTTILMTFLGEFHTQKTRGAAICCLGIFWTISWLILPAMAWAVMSLDFTIEAYGWVFNSWRLFVGMMGIPSLLSAFLVSKYPESPRFLLCQGEDKKTLQVMRKIFASNNNKQPHEYPVTSFIHDDVKADSDNKSITAALNKMWIQLCCLFSPPLFKYLALTAFMMFSNMFGFYGLSLWLPELFNRFEAYYKFHPNETITVCELAYLKEDIMEYTNVTLNVTSEIVSMVSANMTIEACDSFVDPNVFMRSIAIGFSSLLGNFASVYLAGRMDARFLSIATMLVSGVCGCVIYFLRTSMQNLVAVCIFSSFLGTSGVVISSVMVDIFPTNVCSMASATASLSGRFGAILSNLLFGLLLEISCEVPIFLVGGLVILGGLVGFLLPKDPVIVRRNFGKILTKSEENLSELKGLKDLHSVS